VEAITSESSSLDVRMREQKYVSMLYDRLDRLRRETSAELAEVLRRSADGTHQARSERDSAAAMLERRHAQLAAAENNLCFGRIDFIDDRLYVGRLGLFDEDGEYRPLLLDWRAPAARPFYSATGVRSEGVLLRRHIRTVRRMVVGVDDEVFDFDQVDQWGDTVVGEAALLVALNASRTGRMSDIVSTIQADQDRIIRSPLSGVLVVEGGPGTGKTAVALHRVAFLLYTHRQRLEKNGVLVVGPHAQFLHYIGEVLPSLGETGVLSRTLGQLYPGLDAKGRDTWAAAEIKGRPMMVDAVAAAVRDTERVPDVAMKVIVDGYVLYLDQLTCELIRQIAWATGLAHNLARPVVERLIIEMLAKRMMSQLGEEYLDETDFVELQAELREDHAVLAALDQLWPVITPQQLLINLFTSPVRLAVAMPSLSPEELACLRRVPPADLTQDDWWTPEDVPLLDEAAELLGEGEPDRGQTKAEEEALEYARGVLKIIDTDAMTEEEALEYARGVLKIVNTDAMTTGPDGLHAINLIGARQLAERHRVRPDLTAADRASTDRTWTFGHIVVDEAQELSPMAWRTIMRRCPSRSMTIVGDLEQGSAPARTNSWSDSLSPYVGDRWRLEKLTINYRTPAEIMEFVHTELPEFRVTRSVRQTGRHPWVLRIDRSDLAVRLRSIVSRELTATGEGNVALFVPHAMHDEITKIVNDVMAPNLSVQTVALAKGLEYDTVIVIGPDLICAETPSGRVDLYVALTRPTQRLGLLYLEGQQD